MKIDLLCCIGKCGSFDSTDFTLSDVLFFDGVRINVCLFGGGGIFYVVG